METGMVGGATAPEKNNTHKTGRLNPARHANPKKGRKPTNHSGCKPKFMLRPNRYSVQIKLMQRVLFGSPRELKKQIGFLASFNFLHFDQYTALFMRL
jgi:hypothetical protein